MSPATPTAVLDPDGVVVNVVLVDPGADWDPGAGFTLRVLAEGEPVGPGSTWDGQAWAAATSSPGHTENDEAAPPPALDPALVEAWQDATTIAQLRAAGVKLFAALGVTA